MNTNIFILNVISTGILLSLWATLTGDKITAAFKKVKAWKFTSDKDALFLAVSSFLIFSCGVFNCASYGFSFYNELLISGNLNPTRLIAGFLYAFIPFVYYLILEIKFISTHDVDNKIKSIN